MFETKEQRKERHIRTIKNYLTKNPDKVEFLIDYISRMCGWGTLSQADFEEFEVLCLSFKA